MLGLDGDIKKLSREEAVRRAKALPKPELPLQLDDGIRVTRCQYQSIRTLRLTACVLDQTHLNSRAASNRWLNATRKKLTAVAHCPWHPNVAIQTVH